MAGASGFLKQPLDRSAGADIDAFGLGARGGAHGVLFRLVGWFSAMSGQCTYKMDLWVGRRGAFLAQEQFERVHRFFVVPVPEYPLRAVPCQRPSLAGRKRAPEPRTPAAVTERQPDID